MKTKTIITVLVLFFACFTILAQENVNLQYQMSKGKTFVYNSNVATNISQEAMGQVVKIQNDVHSITRLVVDSIEDNGNLDIIVSYDSVSVRTQMQGRDSTMFLKDLIAKRSKLVMTKFGEMISKAQLDTLSKESQMVSSSLMQGATNYFMKLPGKEIKVGDTWNATKVDSVSSMGGMIVVNQDYIYTLGDKVEKNGKSCYKISYTASVASKGNASMSGYDFYIEGNGKITGDAYMSTTDGALISVEGTNDNELTLATTGEQKMVIPVSQSSKITTNLIEE